MHSTFVKVGGQLAALTLSIHPVDFGEQTQVIRIGGECVCRLSDLTLKCFGNLHSHYP